MSEQRVDAVVAGTVPYRVTLATAGRGLEWSCTCPVGTTGEFCKHAVAVALTVTGEEPDAEPSPDPDAALDLPGYVASLDPATLAAIVLEQSVTDWHLHERLVTGARARLDVSVMMLMPPSWSTSATATARSARSSPCSTSAPGRPDRSRHPGFPLAHRTCVRYGGTTTSPMVLRFPGP